MQKRKKFEPLGICSKLCARFRISRMPYLYQCNEILTHAIIIITLIIIIAVVVIVVLSLPSSTLFTSLPTHHSCIQHLINGLVSFPRPKRFLEVSSQVFGQYLLTKLLGGSSVIKKLHETFWSNISNPKNFGRNFGRQNSHEIRVQKKIGRVFGRPIFFFGRNFGRVFGRVFGRIFGRFFRHPKTNPKTNPKIF